MKSTQRQNVLLVADEAAGAHALQILAKSNHNISGVLTSVFSVADADSGQTTGNTSALSKSPVGEVAVRLGIPIFDSKHVRDPEFSAWLRDHHVDVLLNVHALYRICSDVIRAARVGALNLHPGPLPTYSGLNAPSWAIYNQEASHSVTLHHITDTIDTGNIAYETQFPLTSKDTGLSLSLHCVKQGLILVERLLSDLSHDPASIPSRPQDLGKKRTIYKRHQIPGNGFIQWEHPSHKIDAFVRACNYSPFGSPWGEPRTIWNEKEIAITKTHLSDVDCDASPGTIGAPLNGKTSIATGDKWILIDKLKVDGKTILAADYLSAGEKFSSDR